MAKKREEGNGLEWPGRGRRFKEVSFTKLGINLNLPVNGVAANHSRFEMEICNHFRTEVDNEGLNADLVWVPIFQFGMEILSRKRPTDR
jgi:hypothetical protein